MFSLKYRDDRVEQNLWNHTLLSYNILYLWLIYAISLFCYSRNNAKQKRRNNERNATLKELKTLKQQQQQNATRNIDKKHDIFAHTQKKQTWKEGMKNNCLVSRFVIISRGVFYA